MTPEKILQYCLETLPDAVLVDTGGYVSGMFLHRVPGVPHGDAGSGEAQHVNIVFSVSKGHDFLTAEVEIPQDLPDSRSLSALPGDDVKSAGVPPAHLAVGQLLRQRLHAFRAFIGDELVHRVPRISAHRRDGG